MAVRPRDISPFLQFVRNTLIGRKLRTALRFQDQIAPRTQPPPNLPDGPHHKLSSNYYCTRDGRRESLPPLLVADNTKGKTAISAGQNQGTSAAVATSKKTLPTPGVAYIWKKAPNATEKL